MNIVKLVLAITGGCIVLLAIIVLIYSVHEFRRATRDDER